MIRQDNVTSATYGSYGCSVTNRTRFYFSRIYYDTLRYGTLRIDTYGSTVRYGFLLYVTLYARVENRHKTIL